MRTGSLDRSRGELGYTSVESIQMFDMTGATVMVDNDFFDADESYLVMRVRLNGVRMQDDADSGRMLFLTSATGIGRSWVMQHEIATSHLAIGPMLVQLGAGVYMTGQAIDREARFDNFEYCPP